LPSVLQGIKRGREPLILFYIWNVLFMHWSCCGQLKVTVAP
jgi:hypothetical protein